MRQARSKLNHHKSAIKKSTSAAAVGVVAFVVMLFEFPIIPAAPFLKVDLSAVILAVFAILKGNWLAALFIKDFLFFLTKPNPVGVTIDFLLSSIFLASVSLTSHFLTASVLTIIASLIISPIAVKIFTGVFYKKMFWLILQFNLIKWSIIAIVSFIIVKYNKRVVVRLWQKLR